MHFIISFPKTQAGCDAIWVIIDHLTKPVHFLAVKMTYSLEKYAEVYVNEIVRLYRVSKDIIFDHDLRLTLNF